MTLKIAHFSADVIGGAARAAVRLHDALIKSASADSKIIASSKINDDWRNIALDSTYSGRIINQLARVIDRVPLILQRASGLSPRSAAWVGSIRASQINSINADVIHLHWIGSGFLSVEEIGKITKPLVWTLHDMWPFTGAASLAGDDEDARWRFGYSESSRMQTDRGFDVDRWVWQRKQAAWKKPIHIICPSSWLAQCALSSTLMNKWPVTVIPNLLDINSYKPTQKNIAREILGLPIDKQLIAFGAIRGTQLSYKGWDLLKPALLAVSNRLSNIELVIFGQREPIDPPNLGMPIHWKGHLNDDVTLALLYSAADVVVVPSRQESFGQTASEASACGCPVVAFNATGIKDVVAHGLTGYLCKPYSVEDLAEGIAWVLADKVRHRQLSINARDRAVRLWSPEVVIPQYMEMYRWAIEVNCE